MKNHKHHVVSGKNLFITVILNIIITVSQIIGGIISGSLALLSDAIHNLSDVMALLIAYVANKLAAKNNTKDKTFGYKRAEIIAALFNSSVLIGIAIFLIIEAFHKIFHPEIINSGWVIGLGALSIMLNAASVLLIKDDAHSNMNIKAAYLHLITDVMTSIAVVLGGVLMYYFQLFWVDPLISIFIAIYLIFASFGLVRESSAILMQFTPKDIDLDKVIQFITETKEIKNIHHVHVWKLDDKRIHLEAHLDFKENITLEKSNNIIETLEHDLHDLFEIEHTIFQCEYARDDNKNIIV